MAKPSSPERLADVLQRQFHRKALSISAVAVALGENRTSVYGWLSQNSYPADVVVKLARLAELDAEGIDQLEAQFNFALVTPRQRRALSGSESLTTDPSLYRDGARGDLFVRLTCVEPQEWHPTFWATPEYRELLDALRRGARLAYLVPDDKELSRWSQSADLRMLAGAGDMEQAFKRFERAVVMEIAAAREHIGIVRSVAGPFYLPFATLTLHVKAVDRAQDSMGSIRAVLESQARVDESQVRRSRVELPGTYGAQIARFVESSVARVSPQTGITRAIAEAFSSEKTPPRQARRKDGATKRNADGD